MSASKPQEASLSVRCFLGYIGKIGPLSFRMDTKVLSVIRELAFELFLAVVGPITDMERLTP